MSQKVPSVYLKHYKKEFKNKNTSEASFIFVCSRPFRQIRWEIRQIEQLCLLNLNFGKSQLNLRVFSTRLVEITFITSQQLLLLNGTN